MKNSNYLVEHQCPQCGAPIVLSETDRLVTCDFCRVKSYLLQHRYLRYMLPHNAPADVELTYFPYWRFKGMLFACNPKGVNHKFIDVSYQAIESSDLPVSLGLRSQALKLRFVTPETPGRFLKPQLSLDDVMAIFEKRFCAALPKPSLHQAHIGESVSLIYSPYYLEAKLYDAVLNEPLRTKVADDFDFGQWPGGRPKWQTRFVASLCPDCGWDLKGQRDSLVLTCENCQTLWKAGRETLQKLTFGFIPCLENDTLYMPFWRIRAEIEGVNLTTYGDLIQIANLPKVAQDQHHELPFRFWAPASKVRPRVFLRLMGNMTMGAPQIKLSQKLSKKRMYPVTLPITEAIEGLKTNLAGFIKPKEFLTTHFPNINVTPKSFALIYIPFNEGHHDLVQLDYQASINKNMLSFAKNL